MSASPVARQAVSQAIPVSRRVVISHESELPNDLSSTPGGSIFSTTPGGTRIYYDRNFMLSMRSSPLARTPPANLPNIRGVTVPDDRTREAIAEEEANYVDSDDEDAGSNPSSQTAAPNRTSTRLSNGTELSASPPKDKDDDDQFQLEL